MLEEFEKGKKLDGHLNRSVNDPHNYEDQLMSFVELSVLRGHL